MLFFPRNPTGFKWPDPAQSSEQKILNPTNTRNPHSLAFVLSTSLNGRSCRKCCLRRQRDRSRRSSPGTGYFVWGNKNFVSLWPWLFYIHTCLDFSQIIMIWCFSSREQVNLHEIRLKERENVVPDYNKLSDESVTYSSSSDESVVTSPLIWEQLLNSGQIDYVRTVIQGFEAQGGESSGEFKFLKHLIMQLRAKR